jgi:predicted small lipoprotein YifL
MKMKKHLHWMLIILATLLLAFDGCGKKEAVPAPEPEAVVEDVVEEPVVEEEPEAETSEPKEEDFGTETDIAAEIAYDGMYTTKEDVALYLHTYGELPVNFMTKTEASQLGWEGGSLEPYAPGMCIGGDRFGNYEGKLPVQEGYHECDINTMGADDRGAERLVYSDTGNIYYTPDHYNTFEQLYSSKEDQ